MEQFLFLLLSTLLGMGGVTGLVLLGVLLALKYPDQTQKWLAYFYRLLSIVWKGAEKKIISHDLEGRVNAFARSLGQVVPNLDPTGVTVQWIEEGETPDQFFSDNRLVLRLRQHRNQDRNFVNASLVFIAHTVLVRAKKYMSSPQMESLDLFVAKKLFEKEKPGVVDEFYAEHFAPRVEANDKIMELVEKYNVIDKFGFFSPVFVQEMTFLGQKVFFRKRTNEVIVEIYKLIDFLEAHANRPLGQDVEVEFEGKYSRCAIMIVARKFKLQLGHLHPYVNRVESCIERRIESVYMIGPDSSENVAFIEAIGGQVLAKGMRFCFDRRYTAWVVHWEGHKRIERPTYIVLYRHREATHYFDEEYFQRFIEPPDQQAISENS